MIWVVTPISVLYANVSNVNHDEWNLVFFSRSSWCAFVFGCSFVASSRMVTINGLDMENAEKYLKMLACFEYCENVQHFHVFSVYGYANTQKSKWMKISFWAVAHSHTKLEWNRLGVWRNFQFHITLWYPYIHLAFVWFHTLSLLEFASDRIAQRFFLLQLHKHTHTEISSLDKAYKRSHWRSICWRRIEYM